VNSQNVLLKTKQYVAIECVLLRAGDGTGLRCSVHANKSVDTGEQIFETDYFKLKKTIFKILQLISDC
jgi:hypothetical protein